MPAADPRRVQHLDQTAHSPAGIRDPARNLACEPSCPHDEELTARHPAGVVSVRRFAEPHLPSLRRYCLSMKFRRWEWAGWSVAVGVPDRVAARVRRFAGTRQPGDRVVNVDSQARSLVLADAPPFRVEKQDVQASVDAFLAHAPPQVLRDGHDDPAAAIAEESWYHTIELPDGTVTDGRFDHRPLVPHYGLPEDMSGMRALDVGTADGFWAFEMERRGAEVVALELPRMSDRDFPAGAAARLRGERDTPPGHRFELAQSALGSAVELVRMRVYDLDPAELGTFDFVHVGDVLLHLRDPVGGLEAIRSVTSGVAHIADAADARTAGATHAHLNLATYHGG